MKELELRQFRNEDVALFEKWLDMPHVSKWYHDPLDWMDEVKKEMMSFHF